MKLTTIAICSAGVICAGAGFWGVFAAERQNWAGGVPDFSLNEVSWAGFVAPTTPTGRITARTRNDFTPPQSGPGPVTDDPDHPYINNELARQLKVQPTYRVANLNNPNLKPWVIEALRRQNEFALAGRQGLPRDARCWEVGVPAYHLHPGEMYFIQTPKKVILYLQARVRHIYLDVPHSNSSEPSWYGESVGHYEGNDTLVVDTIGFNDATFVDNYRTPHTKQLHLVERFKLIDGGNVLDVSFTVEDPGAFNAPWSGSRPRQRVQHGPLDGHEAGCAEDHNNYFNLDIEQVPTADKPDF